MGRQVVGTDNETSSVGLASTAWQIADAMTYLIRVSRQSDMKMIADKLGSVRAELLLSLAGKSPGNNSTEESDKSENGE